MVGCAYATYHIMKCVLAWIQIPLQEWTHLFIHALDIILHKWYKELELRHGTMEWDSMVRDFNRNFNFEDENQSIDTTLQIIKGTILFEEPEEEKLEWDQHD